MAVNYNVQNIIVDNLKEFETRLIIEFDNAIPYIKYIENEKNHDTVHVLSVHTSKDDAVAEWIKRDDLELQKQMTSMHSFSKGVKV